MSGCVCVFLCVCFPAHPFFSSLFSCLCNTRYENNLIHKMVTMFRMLCKNKSANKTIITVFTVSHPAVCTVSISHTYFVPELHFVLYFLFFAGFRNYLGCSRTFGRWMDVCIVCVAQSMISIWSRLTRHLISVRIVFFSFSLMIVGYTGYQLFFCFVYIAVSFLVLCVCLFVFELGFNQRLTMQI